MTGKITNKKQRKKTINEILLFNFYTSRNFRIYYLTGEGGKYMC